MRSDHGQAARRKRDGTPNRESPLSGRRAVVNFVHAAREAVKGVLSELDLDIAIQEQPEFYNTALVLLSAPICGPDPARLAKFTGLPYSFIAPIRRRMMQAELWTDAEVHCEEWYAADGVLRTRYFWLDVLVAEGLVTRAWDEAESQYCYGHCPQFAETVH
jgi:hypothetical protein